MKEIFSKFSKGYRFSGNESANVGGHSVCTAPELLLYLHATLQPFVLTVVKEKENQKRVKGMLDRPKIAKDDAGDDLQDEFITFVSLSYRASFVDNRERSYIIQRKPIL